MDACEGDGTWHCHVAAPPDPNDTGTCTMQIIPAQNHKIMVWKNGGGETREIAVFPANAGLADFDWRISTAYVVFDGPFSPFPGIDRTLAVLEGDGLGLKIEGRDMVVLTQASLPFSFSGDSGVDSGVSGESITDLNVMTRRGRFSHSVERRHLAGEHAMATCQATTALFCQNGRVRVETPDGPFDLGPFDTLMARAAGAPWTLIAEEPATVYVIAIKAA